MGIFSIEISRNFDCLCERFDYLKDLGIDVIYLTPIFKANSPHKYDTVDYYSIDPQFGTIDTAKELGRKDGTKMERLAAAITESLIKKADYYIDLHGGDDYEELTPYVYFAGVAKPEIMEASRKMAEQVDVPYMVQSNVSTGVT